MRSRFRHLSRRFRWIFVLGYLKLTGEALADDDRLGPLDRPSPQELRIAKDDEAFSAREALHGATSSRQQCMTVPGGLWTEAGGQAECIRHYSAGVENGQASALLVYLSGDAVSRTSGGVRFVVDSYAARSPNAIQAETEKWAAEAAMAAVYLARPGLHGSSGSHLMRRLKREVDLVDRALDLLKDRYGTTRFIIAGHSGGGHLAAALLNRRHDVDAVVISSGLVSVRQVVEHWDRRRKVPEGVIYDADGYIDPVDGLGSIRKDPMPRIFVISDPEDRIVPFYTQLYYVRRLRAAGFRPQHIYASASDKRHHLLVQHARTAAALVAGGASNREVRRALAEIGPGDFD
ncbi:alpha/beta hydrolase [Terrihabitans rhizophilus]|uniref:Alpha/beta hydrolase n=1 Tax=Terrihabitans rhizophilus TaxID=3092662 RepID=A0ABU4RQ00_9HYPH|nr:alpha/beta hydrolase [Terrihabitans sp. PJ23]MDX6806916.1 alpha/beta hydrolase [Terrihabitans sp. PJ23]